ncbi:MAG TPA: DUF72 domain-containing protein [Longimicrobiales bacterium]|nr:DUF72 domain-containing protein [Longimicrobiales bacterium]
MPETRIGVSGWSYDAWAGEFFPPGLPKSARLHYASRQFNSIEINGSFYSLLTPRAYRRHREVTPPGFLFSVKGSQYITHSRKLVDARVPLANFLASGVLRLEEKLGPILWQFPAVRFDHDRLRAFLALLPRDTEAAGRLARRHDERVTGRASMKVDALRPIRHAVEFRHESFFTDDVVEMLREHDVALVASHSGSWPYAEEVTASFVYLRLHGAPRSYASAYGRARLERWADKIRAWASGSEPADAARITSGAPPRQARDVFVYFDNDQFAHAPRDARLLMEILGVEALADRPE